VDAELLRFVLRPDAEQRLVDAELLRFVPRPDAERRLVDVAPPQSVRPDAGSLRFERQAADERRLHQ